MAVRFFPRTPGVTFAGCARRLHHGFYGVAVRADLFSNPFGAGSPFLSAADHLCFYSAVLGLLDGALDIHAGDCHSVQHQSGRGE